MEKAAKKTRWPHYLAAITITSLGFVLSFSALAGAANPGPVWNGRAQFHGYFSNTQGYCNTASTKCANGESYCLWSGANCIGPDQNDVLPPDWACKNNPNDDALPLDCIGKPGDTQNQKIDQLINLLKGYSGDTNPRKHASSAFLYWTLKGQNGTYAYNHGGRDLTNAQWNDLDNTLKAEEANNQININWNEWVSSNWRTFSLYLTGGSQKGKGDVTYYDGNTSPSGPQTGEAIVIRDTSGNIIYELFRACANPGGVLQGLPALKTTPAPHCDGYSLNPAAPEPKQQFKVTAKVNFTPTADNGGAAAISDGDKIRIMVTGPANHSNTFTPTEMPAGNKNVIGAIMSMTAGANGGTYNVEWQLLDKNSKVLLDCNNNFDVIQAICDGAVVSPTGAVPTPLEPNQPFKITATIGYNPPSGAGKAFGPDTFFIQVNGQPIKTTTNPQNPGSGGNGTVTFTANFPGGLPNTGRYSFTYGTTGSVVPITCPASNFDVVDLPYFAVSSGDVQTGSCMYTSPNQATQTSVDNFGSVVSWSQEQPGAYAGAGAQYAAMALGYLQDFATAQNPPNGLSGKGLGFANTVNVTGSGSGQDTYGGGFSGYPSCVPDYYGTPPAGQVHTGNYSVPPQNIGPGTHQIIYVNGNAYISNNIIYMGTGSYANVSDIPSFALIVKGGNIYINGNVNELDGLYVAEPNPAGAGGTIYTCTSAAFVAAPLNPSLYSNCDHHLTVNGAFVAKQVQLLRTSGTLHSSQPPAETFNFNPEVWLTTPPIGGVGSTAGNDDYDAITGLPPAL